MHTTLPHNDFSSIEVEFPREQLEIDLGEGEDYFFFLWTKSLWRDPLGWDVWQKDALRGLATVGDDDFKLQKIVALDFRVSPPDGERLKLIQINEPIPPIVARKTL